MRSAVWEGKRGDLILGKSVQGGHTILCEIPGLNKDRGYNDTSPGFPVAFHLYISRGASSSTFVSGRMDSVIQTLPPMTERLPITVSPPRIVAPE